MSFVHHYGVVASEQGIFCYFSKQDSISHELYFHVSWSISCKPVLPANYVSKSRHFLSHTLSDSNRCYTAWLCTGNNSFLSASRCKAYFGNLRCFAGSCLSAYNNYLMGFQGINYLLFIRQHRQFRRIKQRITKFFFHSCVLLYHLP